MSYVIAIAILAALILVHELGHMWVARACGMRVERFSIFFGPVLFSWQGKRTRYQLASIPVGGFVQIAGMNPHEGASPGRFRLLRQQARLGSASSPSLPVLRSTTFLRSC
jgi:regulator of sigma E protease